MFLNTNIIDNVRLVKHFDKNCQYGFDEKIVVCFSPSENYVKYMIITLISLLLNNCKIFFSINIFVDSIKDRDLNNLNKIINEYDNVDIKVHTIDEKVFGNIYISKQYTVAGYFRILLPKILNEEDYILYLDSDILCLNKIDEIFDLKLTLGNNIVGVVDDVGILKGDRAEFLPNVLPEEYFNSGFLLINVKEWNENNITEKVLETLEQFGDKFHFPDQDALNVVLNKKVFYMEDKWNFVYLMGDCNEKETIFYHFIGAPKPWHSWFNDKKMYKLYLKYEAFSQYKIALVEKPQDNYRQARQYMWFLFRKGRIITGLFWLYRYKSLKKKCANQIINI